jgi:hypothetical protein
VEEVESLLGLCLLLSEAIVEEELETVMVSLDNGIVYGGKPLISFEIDIVGVSDSIEHILNALDPSKLSRKHKRCTFLFIHFFQIGSTFDQHLQIFATLKHRSIVYGFSAQTVAG